MTRWQAFIADLRTPGGDQTVRDRMLTALGHMLVGAFFTALLAPVAGFWVAVLVVTLAYGASKEVADVRRGGNWRDGLIDTAYVGLGGTVLALDLAPALATAGLLIFVDGWWGARLRQ